MLKNMSVIILCLLLVVNTLVLSSCLTTGIPAHTSQNEDASGDSPKASLPEASNSTTDSTTQESEPPSSEQQPSSYSELPVIDTFEADPEDISEGETSSLSWSISNASSFTISPSVFRQTGPIVITEDTPDNATVSPSVTTSYTLTAINDMGSVNETITITVSPQAVLDWSGTWDTNWGTMYLTQSLGKVTGTYEYDDGRIGGYISKNLSGNMVAGTWSEYPSYEPPDDAGDIEFTMSPDGNSFTGRWRYGSSGNWNGDWSGTRISP